jgi:hypothetical protein
MKISIILGTRPGIKNVSYLSFRERSPFIVKAYKYDEDIDKELEIHFWYEVR